MMKKVLFTAAAIGAVAAAPASAVTFTAQFGNGASFNQTTFAGYSTTNVFDFQTAGQLEAAGFSTAGTVQPVVRVQGNLPGQYVAPTGSAGNYYIAVQGGGTFQAAKNTPGFSLISLYVSTLDNYNSIQILDTAGNVLRTVGNADFTALGLNTGGSTSYRLTFTRDSGEAAFGGLRVSSTQNSAEFDNLVFAVPEPSTWALMLAGFGMVGMAMRARRRRTSVVFG